MPAVTVGRENTGDIEIYDTDQGAWQPVVLIHGYPLSGRAWDKQLRRCWPTSPTSTRPTPNGTARTQEADPSISRTSTATASPG
jgi:pimeloyl-ACP methyl ester carboxylesterase